MSPLRAGLFLLAISLGALAQEAPVGQSLESQPVIKVEEPNIVTPVATLPEKATPASVEGATPEKISTVDTESASPIAPQSYDGFEGVVQEPFAPTQAEKQAALQKRRDEEKKALELAEKKQSEKPMPKLAKSSPSRMPASVKAANSGLRKSKKLPKIAK